MYRYHGGGKGQNLVEALVLMTAVIIVVALFLRRDGLFAEKLNNTILKAPLKYLN